MYCCTCIWCSTMPKNSEGSFLFLLYSLIHWVTPTQLHAEPGELCPHVYLYSSVGCRAHVQLYKLAFSLITLSTKFKWDTPPEEMDSLWCHSYALDASASITGSTVCLYRKCTWGRRPSAQWTGSTSTARTSPGWRPSMPAESASTARHWSCRPLRVRWASSPSSSCFHCKFKSLWI